MRALSVDGKPKKRPSASTTSRLNHESHLLDAAYDLHSVQVHRMLAIQQTFRAMFSFMFRGPFEPRLMMGNLISNVFRIWMRPRLP